MIFVDTSFWIALQNVRDPRHVEAAQLLKKHHNQRLITSNHVRGETWTYLRRKAGHAAALRFLDGLERSQRIEVEFAAEEVERRAILWLKSRPELEYSFVDATSFAMMEVLRVGRAFSFDADFTAAGFVTLRA